MTCTKNTRQDTRPNQRHKTDKGKTKGKMGKNDDLHTRADWTSGKTNHRMSTLTSSGIQESDPGKTAKQGCITVLRPTSGLNEKAGVKKASNTETGKTKLVRWSGHDNYMLVITVHSPFPVS